MIIVLIFLAGGIACGIIFRRNLRLFKINKKLTDYSIYLLLFFLGVSVSRNEEIIENIGQIGLQVLLITFGAVSGSVLLAWITYKIFFESENEK